MNLASQRMIMNDHLAGRGDRADERDAAELLGVRNGAALTQNDELPVVARVVVEIRSDGSRTIARGAAEDAEGRRVAIDARGSTHFALAVALSRSLMSVARPTLPGSGVLRRLLPGRKRR